MITLPVVEQAFVDHRLRGALRPEASVAAILAPGERGAEVLLIERAQRPGDPWSGHMAFPGGRREPGDHDSQDTALRETFEEVGLRIPRSRHLARLPDQHPRLRAGFTVAAHVFTLPEPADSLSISGEVQQGWWVPLIDLVDPVRYRDYAYPSTHEGGRLYPGIAVGEPERVVWGMTHRFLEDFLGALGYQLPAGKR